MSKAFAPRRLCSLLTQGNHRSFLIWLASALLLIGPAGLTRAEEGDDEYLRLFAQLQDADTLDANGKPELALARYKDLQVKLQLFKKEFPKWNPAIVNVRQKFLAEKVLALTEKLAPPPAPAKAEGTSGTTAGAAQAQSGQIKLLTAGSEPKTALRLRPKAGETQTVAIAVDTGIDTKVGEMEAQKINLPTMTFTVEIMAKSVSENGDIEYTLAMKETKVGEDAAGAPPVGAALKAALAGLKDVSGSGTMSERGVVKASKLNTSGTADPQAQQIVSQIKDLVARTALPLPEEAVGAGARWEVKTQVASQGLTINQTTTYELASVEGTTVKTRDSVVQQAGRQKMDSPMMPGMKVEVIKMNGQGKGEATVDLGKLLPVEGAGELASDSAMSIEMAGQSQAMSMKTKTKSKLTGK